MPNQTITFQLATHFLPKIALRLEYLLLTIEQAITELHPIIHLDALKNTVDVIKLIEKPELKSRFLKEFMRIEHHLKKNNLPISDKTYASLFIQIQLLNQSVGQFGEQIHQDPFLQSMRLAHTTHSHDSELYPPQLLLWLENTPEKRQADLSGWLKQFQSLKNTVEIYLSLLRHTASFETIDMHHGFYQRPITSKTSCHLILLRMDKQGGIVPKMQLGHHGLSIRLCEAHSMNELRRANMSVELAICQL